MKKSKNQRRLETAETSTVKKRRRKCSRKQRKKTKGGQKWGRRKPGRVRLVGEIKLLLVVLALILLLFIGILSAFYSIKVVSGYGMMPSLRDQDVLLIKRKNELKRFDIVLIENGIEGEFRRIIGLPGERISYQEDTLYVDGQPLDEKFIVGKVNESQAKGKNFTGDMNLLSIGQASEIPQDCYLVLGDNRPYTTDSRDYGLVRKQVIGGKIRARLWPLEMAETF